MRIYQYRAARIAALRGHNVTLYEKNSQLGGHLIEASVPKFKEDIGNFKDWLVRQMNKVGVKVVLGMEITSAALAEVKPDAGRGRGQNPHQPLCGGATEGQALNLNGLKRLGRDQVSEPPGRGNRQPCADATQPVP